MKNDWTMDSIQIATVKGARKVHCYVSDSVKGLAVSRSESDTSWRITHIPSGRALFAACDEAEPLMRAAGVFAALGDWTRSDQAIWADKEFWELASREAKRLWEDTAFFALSTPVDSAMPEDIREMAIKKAIARGGDGTVHQVTPLGANSQPSVTPTGAVEDAE